MGLNRRSGRLTDGSKPAAEAFLRGLQLTDEQLTQAQVGIGVPWLHGNLCNTHTPRLAEAIRTGCESAKVVGMPFGLPGVSDAISMSHGGMRYSLPSRELIAWGIEMVMNAHLYDGFVGIHACDKNGPGAVIAMARLNLPSLLVVGGTIMPGCHEGKDITVKDAFRANALERIGRCSKDERDAIVGHACPGPGGCGAMYTFNTMGCVFEAMGLTLPYSSSTPAVDPLKIEECERVGEAMKKLIRQDLRPLDLLTRKAFENGITTAAAIGGSTNVVLHLLAIAHAAGVHLALSDFQEIFRKTPVVANFAPRGPKVMADLHRVGGTPALIKQLLEMGLLHDIMTVTGRTLSQNVAELPGLTPGQDVVLPEGRVLKGSADLQILHGSLAPKGAVFKVPYDVVRFEGPARVFDGEETMMRAAAAGGIKPGDVVVIRYVGPKAAGMPEMLGPTSAISEVPELAGGNVALVTDGRFSGVSTGFIGGHVTPEALDEGPIAFVQDGDNIIIDLASGEINLDVPPAVLEKRQPLGFPPAGEPGGPFLDLYRALVSSAQYGCVLKSR